MATQTRLKLTLKNVVSDRTWTNQPLEITADPEDHDVIRPHIEQLARDLDGMKGDPWWMHHYKLHVQGIDQHWWDYWLSGGGN